MTEENKSTKAKVLIIEDDSFFRDLVAKSLSNRANLVYAKNSEEAFEILAEVLPDIILLDIMLPGVDGFEILKKLKQEEKTQHVPVIILSNLGSPADIEKGKTLGAARFLVKAAVSLEEIASSVAEVLTRKNDA